MYMLRECRWTRSLPAPWRIGPQSPNPHFFFFKTPTAHRPLGPSAPRHAAAAREDAAAGRGHGDGAVVDCRARPQFCGYPGTYIYIYIVVGFGVYWPVSSAKATLSTPANHTHLPNTNQPLNGPNQPPPKQTGGGQGQELGLRRRDRGPAPDDHDAGAQGAAVPEREGCVCVVVCLYLVMCVDMNEWVLTPHHPERQRPPTQHIYLSTTTINHHNNVH